MLVDFSDTSLYQNMYGLNNKYVITYKMTFITDPTNGVRSLNNTTTLNVGGSDTLNGGIDGVTTTILLNDSTMFPTTGTVKIDSEYITFTANNGTALSGGSRGAFNSTAISHLTGAAVIGVYIGTSELSTHPDVMVSLKGDRSGTEYFEFSNDNVQWDIFPVTGFQTSANIHEFHTAVKGRRYFRVRWENGGATATTAFRVNTYFGVFQQGNLPLNQSISDDSDARIVRSVGVGSAPDGSYSNVRLDGVAFETVALLGPAATYSSGVLSLIDVTSSPTLDKARTAACAPGPHRVCPPRRPASPGCCTDQNFPG